MLGKKRLVEILSDEIGVSLKLKDVIYQKNYFGSPEMVKFYGSSIRTVYDSNILLFTDESNVCKAI